MKRTLILFPVILLLISTTATAQTSKPWPKTLLWRISGNGLKGNSYLFGTMHLEDKRIFNFTDSLYQYLEQADGYAMEVDLQEFADSVFQKILDQREDEMIDEKRLAKKSDKTKIIDSLMQNVLTKNDKASKKQLELIRKYKTRNLTKHHEMPTIMDAYLYGIARREGKWVGGIEDVQDQMFLFDELGGNMTHKELSASDDETSVMLEKMISIYQANDLEQLEKFALHDTPTEWEDKLLTKRNIKMAARMDSLSAIRKMFFAVGAAHLPGQGGVINLLRKKGFSVDPVFSTTTIDPVKYTVHLNSLPWIKTEDEAGTYRVEMPGKPSELNMFNNFIKMKLYVDISTMTYFMSGSTASAANVDLTKITDALSKNTDATILDKKMIDKDDVKGIECVMTNGGYFYKVQYLYRDNRLYIMMAGGETVEKTETPDVSKFFNSLVINKTEHKASPIVWTPFSLTDKAFAISFPGGVPKRNTRLEKKAEGSDWIFTVYDYADPVTGVYYMVQIRDVAPGFHLDGDSAFFALFRDNFKTVIDKKTKDTMITVETFPAYSYEGLNDDKSVLFKTLTINRGSRIYNLFAGGANTDKAAENMDDFFRTFKLTDYQPSVWKKEQAPGNNFTTVVPQPVVIKKPKKAEDDEQPVEKDEAVHYISYNPANDITYEVYKHPISRYYWTNSDSSFFSDMIGMYKSWNDSVISKKVVTNGHLRGMEWLLKEKRNNNLKQIRQVLNGDTLYTLASFIATQYINEKEHQQFFDEFRVVRENTNTDILKSKAALLLKDLQSTDSSTYTKAEKELSSAKFGKGDLPLLQQALIASYHDDSLDLYQSTRSVIIGAMDELSNNGTVDFVKQQYPLLKGEKERIKTDLIEVLSRYKTDYSYSTIKDLLINQAPAVKRNWMLGYHMDDSLQLTRKLFPEILRFINDTLYATDVINLASQLIDSNMITADMLRPYEKNLIHIGDTAFAGIRKRKTEDNGYSYSNLINLVRCFKDAESNKMLQDGLLSNDLFIKQNVAIALLKNEQPVAAKELEKIAAKNWLRRDFYDELTAIGKEKFFPASYLTQQYMAASDMYAYAADENDPDTVRNIASKVVVYHGEKKRFYLFRIPYSYTDDNGSTTTNEYLGIAGPYALDSKKIDVPGDDDATGIYYDHEFDAKKIEEYFSEYIKGKQE